jgi:putative phosphoribosyl transferase
MGPGEIRQPGLPMTATLDCCTGRPGSLVSMDGYRDRSEAGRALAEHLWHHLGSSPLVLGIPRGGVVVAHALAVALGGALGVLPVRRLGSPSSPELVVGAMAPDGLPFVDGELVRRLGITEEEMAAEAEARLAELRRIEEVYGPAGRPGVTGRTVIVVDEGVATGLTMRAVLGFVRRRGPAFLACAVPVGPPSVMDLIASEVDEVVCPLQPIGFRSAADWYQDLASVSEADVTRLLRAGD